MTKKPLTLLK